jgi:hypothetical protein
MTTAFYDASFATLGRLYGPQAKSMITGVALVGGFAMATSWPLTALLMETVGWRGTCFCYAGMHIVVGLPLHLFLLPVEARRSPSIAPTRVVTSAESGCGTEENTAIRRRSLSLWLLGANLTLSVCIGSMVQVHLLTLLHGLGLELTAGVALGSLLWLAQGSGRLIEIFIGRYCHPVWEGVLASLLVLVGLALLFPMNSIVIAIGLVVFGIGNGIRIILKGTLPLILFGDYGYASLIGRLAFPTLVAQAGAPALGAIALAMWSTTAAIIALVILALINLCLSVALRRAVPQPEHAVAALREPVEP